jgi:hypothetical protein
LNQIDGDYLMKKMELREKLDAVISLPLCVWEEETSSLVTVHIHIIRDNINILPIEQEYNTILTKLSVVDVG